MNSYIYILALFLVLSGTQICVCEESLVSFLTWSYHNRNTCQTRAFRKATICTLFNQIHVQHSVHMISPPTIHVQESPQQLDKKPAIFALFHVLSLRACPHAIKIFLPPFNLWRCSREKTYQALQQQAWTSSHSRVWEPGNEATYMYILL